MVSNSHIIVVLTGKSKEVIKTMKWYIMDLLVIILSTVAIVESQTVTDSTTYFSNPLPAPGALVLNATKDRACQNVSEPMWQ